MLVFDVKGSIIEWGISSMVWEDTRSLRECKYFDLKRLMLSFPKNSIFSRDFPSR
jgi:hypothetical protein